MGKLCFLHSRAASNKYTTKDKREKISLEALTNKKRRKGSLEEKREDEKYYQIKINLTFKAF